MKFIRWINKIIEEREKSIPISDFLETILRNKLSYKIEENNRKLFVLDRTDADPAGIHSNVELDLDTSGNIKIRAFYKINRKGNVLVWATLCGYHIYKTRRISRALSVYQKMETIVPSDKIIRLDAPPWYPIQGYTFEDTAADTTMPMFASEAKAQLDKYVEKQYLEIIGTLLT